MRAVATSSSSRLLSFTKSTLSVQTRSSYKLMPVIQSFPSALTISVPRAFATTAGEPSNPSTAHLGLVRREIKPRQASRPQSPSTEPTDRRRPSTRSSKRLPRAGPPRLKNRPPTRAVSCRTTSQTGARQHAPAWPNHRARLLCFPTTTVTVSQVSVFGIWLQVT